MKWDNGFNELKSQYLVKLMNRIKVEKGENDPEYLALYYQYTRQEIEICDRTKYNLKHYEAVVGTDKSGLRYVERLYKRQATVDLTQACSAHCRYCLRQNYDNQRITSEDIAEIVTYFAKEPSIREILITGGDPLLVPGLLMELIDQLLANAPNIGIIRIGTRLPVQNPLKLDSGLLKYFKVKEKKAAFEIGLQVNHAVELQPEVLDCIRSIREAGVTIYAQNVLLRNLNDNLEALIGLYDTLRYAHIESHYIFHPIPLIGTSAFRMPLVKFMDLARELTSCGEISGRVKPMFTIMTDIGKCTLYQGMAGEKDQDDFYEIKTGYYLKDRQTWNPQYILPATASVGPDGTLSVKYLDGD